MLGSELISYIQENEFEDFDFIVSHDTGSAAYSITEAYPDYEHQEVELY